MLTATEQGLVHKPDEGEAVLTGLWDADLVAGKHMALVLLHLQVGSRAQQAA